MIRTRLFLIFVLLQWALFVSHGARGNDAPVLVLGDSISAALGVPAGKGWVELLGERWREQGLPPLVNASISGETTAGGLARLDELLQQHQPQIVVIELGGNDGLRGYPLDLTRANLAAMIAASQAAGARVLLLGMRIPPNYGPRYSEGFHALFAQLASETGVASVPFLLEGIATNPDLMQADGIHPSEQAQPLIVANVLDPLSALLRD